MKANHTSTSVALRLGVALFSIGIVGCSSTMQSLGRSTPREAIAKRVEASSAQVAEVNSRIDGTLQSLDAMANHPGRDLERQFRTYTGSLDKLEGAADKLRDEVEAMQQEGREYLVAWDREIATIQDEDLRNSTQERRNEVAERIDALHSRYVNARESLAPLLQRLQEVETALKVDLTAAGIESVRPSVGNLDGVDSARNALRELADAFRQASVSLAAAQPLSRLGSDND